MAIRERFGELRTPTVRATARCRDVSVLSCHLDRLFAFQEKDRRVRVRECNFMCAVQRRLDGFSSARLPAAASVRGFLAKLLTWPADLPLYDVAKVVAV